MCRQLDELRQSILAFARQFDARSLTPWQAADVIRVCAQIEASISSLKALAAARAAESKEWQADGYRSPADFLARSTGVSPAAAKRTLDTGKRLAGQPEVAEAALSGQLSAEQAEAVSDGAAANPGKTRELLDKAQHRSLPELNEEVARAKAEVTDQEGRRKAHHAKRSLRRWSDRDGAFHAHLFGNPEDGVSLWRLLDPIRRRLIILRRESAPNQALEALDYDALMTVAAIAAGQDSELSLAELLDLGLFPQLDTNGLEGRRPAPPPDPGPDQPEPSGPPLPPPRRKKLAGSPARVMIRVDLDTLLRGVTAEGELCEIVGYGPIPVSVVEELIANENAFVVGLLTRSQQIQGVFHHGRRPNAHQRSALDFLYPSCAVKGCSARAGLQSDHREDWATTKFTVFDFLDRLCPHHHRLKTNHGWGLIEGIGKRDFVPPEDSRHPHRSRRRSLVTRSGPDP